MAAAVEEVILHLEKHEDEMMHMNERQDIFGGFTFKAESTNLFLLYLCSILFIIYYISFYHAACVPSYLSYIAI